MSVPASSSSSSSMAPVRWSNLPTDILTLLSKILNTDVDILRLRSVCSSWRASIRPRLRPSPFPLKLPPLNSDSTSPNGDHCFLNYTTLYHLSPPRHGPHAGDPSDGWLFRALEVNPNRFCLLAPLFPNKLEFPPGTIPKCLNLLDYRISEVCKCYNLKFAYGKRPDTDSLKVIPNKVIALWNYAVGCEFAVLALFPDSCMKYWKFGDKEWTSIDIKEYVITDVVTYKGKFYAIGRQAVLVSFDSEFNLTEVNFPHMPVHCVETDNFLVEFKSDLYVFSKVLDYPSDDEEDDLNEVPLRLEIFKKCHDWELIGCLGDGIFLSSDDFSVGLSVKDFRGLKGNRVYFAHTDFAYSFIYNAGIFYGEYNLDNGRRTSIMKMGQDTLLYWPPPGWLMSS